MDSSRSPNRQYFIFTETFFHECKNKTLRSVQVSLIDALKEIQTHDPDVEQVLSSEYKYILGNAEKLKALLKRQPSYLNRLYGNLEGISENLIFTSNIIYISL